MRAWSTSFVFCHGLIAAGLLLATSLTSLRQSQAAPLDRGLAADHHSKVLGDMLRESGWDRLMGTWVDKETNGQRAKLTYAWAVPERVIELRVSGDNPSVALIGIDAMDGDIFHVGGDSQGNTFRGTYSARDDGAAVLSLELHTASGDQVPLKLEQELAGDDAFRLTVDLPDRVVMDFIRSVD